MKKESEIKLNVSLDENKLPESITWHATDSGMEQPAAVKAFFLSLWDGSNESTLRVDLWTKDMPLEDMKRFFYETLVTMADTYQRATSDEDNAALLKQFAKRYGEKEMLIKQKK